MKLRADPMSLLKLQALKLLFLSPRPRSLLRQASHLIVRPTHLPKRCISRSDSTDMEWTPQVHQTTQTACDSHRRCKCRRCEAFLFTFFLTIPILLTVAVAFLIFVVLLLVRVRVLRVYTAISMLHRTRAMMKCLLAQRLTIMGTPC